MAAGVRAIKYISGNLSGGIDPEDTAGLRDPPVLCRTVDVSITTCYQLRGPASIVALEPVESVPHTCESDLKDSAYGWVASNTVQVAVAPLDERAGIAAVIAASKGE